MGMEGIEEEENITVFLELYLIILYHCESNKYK